MIWDERKHRDAYEFILHPEKERSSVSPVKPPAERVADTARPAIVPATAADRPVSSTSTRNTSTATTDRMYGTFSDVSSASSATLPSDRTTPVTLSRSNTTVAEWVEEQRKAPEKQWAQEGGGRRAQDVRHRREQEAKKKIQREQEAAERAGEERKVQEMRQVHVAAEQVEEMRQVEET